MGKRRRDRNHCPQKQNKTKEHIKVNPSKYQQISQQKP
jgi:hypothetical protein